MTGLRRFWQLLLSAGAYEGEPPGRRSPRRIFLVVIWVSVPLLMAASAGDAARPWLAAIDGSKAAAHLGGLLLLWVWPRRIAAIFLTVFAIDLVADVAASILLGGLYESGLQILWSLTAVWGLLVISTVRVAAFFLGAFIGALVVVVGASSPADARYALEDPEGDAAFTMILVALFVFLGLFYFVRERNRFQQESDDLLHNILPDEIAARLRGGGEMIADYYDDVSVLFLDVVDFTPMSATMSPEQLVGVLNDIFSDFDGFVEEAGLEKIKTVGDEYMVAAGVPVTRDDHAHAIADLALRIREHLSAREFAGHRIAVRIGINSGPVVAGIIGRRKFSYDLWGDVVNTASRMESHGEPGAIQISAATHDRIKDGFECERRGTIDVKGKGRLETWFLHRRLEGARS